MDPPTLVLASGSPYRAALLERLDVPFETCAPDIDERPLPGETPERLVARLAEAKAQAVHTDFPSALVIGSDQAAVLDRQILGKPGNHARAVQQLLAAAGREVIFYTGLCVFNTRTGRANTAVEPFRVQFRPLTEKQIDHYLQREQPYQCAGSFRAEGLGIALFECLQGDDPNALIGLPLIRLTEMLVQAGYPIL